MNKIRTSFILFALLLLQIPVNNYAMLSFIKNNKKVFGAISCFAFLCYVVNKANKYSELASYADQLKITEKENQIKLDAELAKKLTSESPATNNPEKDSKEKDERERERERSEPNFDLTTPHGTQFVLNHYQRNRQLQQQQAMQAAGLSGNEIRDLTISNSGRHFSD